MKRSIRRYFQWFMNQQARLRRGALYVVAFVWRRLLFRTTFVAITGSVGKTTAKECLAAILSSRFPIAKTIRSNNTMRDLIWTVLHVRPWHRFAVVEVATDGPGWMSRMAPLVRPDIAIVLSVARTHTNRFRTLEDTATEKARLLGSLSKRGVAVLNGDDRRVVAMPTPGKRRATFGTESCHALWAEPISSEWPRKLSMDVHWGSETFHIETQLIGTHWLPSVLGALLGAIMCGMSLAEAAEGIKAVKPMAGRMQPVILPVGATVIRDEENQSFSTWEAAAQVLAHAKAQRKVLVVSDMLDCRQRPRQRMRDLGQQSACLADIVIFVGDRSERAAQAALAANMPPDRVHYFYEYMEAAQYLRTELRAHDLVLLKGQDHLSRILFAQFGSVRCRKTRCRKSILCDECDELGAQSIPEELRVCGCTSNEPSH
jgi:UDP-N-acetylmuramoyl-tripeptide--D-alanyl-D-alanine ligase